MATYKIANCKDGESIELQDGLRADEVTAFGPDVLGVVHDTDATQATYERHIARERGPRNIEIEIPDSAVVVELGVSGIHYLTEA